MTISQKSIKQPLEKDFNKTLKIFESNNAATNNMVMTNSSKATLRKSLIPTIINQKTYYSKFPFEKIIETQQKNIKEANNNEVIKSRRTPLLHTNRIKDKNIDG